MFEYFGMKMFQEVMTATVEIILDFWWRRDK